MNTLSLRPVFFFFHYYLGRYHTICDEFGPVKKLWSSVINLRHNAGSPANDNAGAQLSQPAAATPCVPVGATRYSDRSLGERSRPLREGRQRHAGQWRVVAGASPGDAIEVWLRPSAAVPCIWPPHNWEAVAFRLRGPWCAVCLVCTHVGACVVRWMRCDAMCEKLARQSFGDELTGDKVTVRSFVCLLHLVLMYRLILMAVCARTHARTDVCVAR